MRILGRDLRKIIKEELHRSGQLREAAEIGVGASGPEVVEAQKMLIAALRKIGARALDLPSSLRDDLKKRSARGSINPTNDTLQAHVLALAEAIEMGGPDGQFGPMSRLATLIVQALPYRVDPDVEVLSSTGMVDSETRAVLAKATSPGAEFTGSTSRELVFDDESPENLLSDLLSNPDASTSAGYTVGSSDPSLSRQLERLGIDTDGETVIRGKILLTVDEDGMSADVSPEFVGEDGTKYSYVDIPGARLSLVPSRTRGKTDSIILMSSKSPGEKSAVPGSYFVDATLTINVSPGGIRTELTFDQSPEVVAATDQ